MIASQPLVFAQSSLKDARTAVELLIFGFENFLIRTAFHERFDDIFDQVDVAGGEP